MMRGELDQQRRSPEKSERTLIVSSNTCSSSVGTNGVPLALPEVRGVDRGVGEATSSCFVDAEKLLAAWRAAEGTAQQGAAFERADSRVKALVELLRR